MMLPAFVVTLPSTAISPLVPPLSLPAFIVMYPPLLRVFKLPLDQMILPSPSRPASTSIQSSASDTLLIVTSSSEKRWSDSGSIPPLTIRLVLIAPSVPGVSSAPNVSDPLTSTLSLTVS